MKKNIVTSLMLLSLVSMISPSCSTVKTYNIEWKLDNGTVLKVDKVEEGVVPQYTGETPTKESTNDAILLFTNNKLSLKDATGANKLSVKEIICAPFSLA